MIACVARVLLPADVAAYPVLVEAEQVTERADALGNGELGDGGKVLAEAEQDGGEGKRRE